MVYLRLHYHPTRSAISAYAVSHRHTAHVQFNSPLVGQVARLMYQNTHYIITDLITG